MGVKRMRIPVIAGNWKMNKTIVESVSLVKELKDFVRGIKGVDIVVCPPFTSLWLVKEIINGTNIHPVSYTHLTLPTIYSV